MTVEERPRSRLLDFVDGVEGIGPDGAGTSGGATGRMRSVSVAGEGNAPRSALRDYVDSEGPLQTLPDGRPGPKPGVPPYHTPVVVPAHPRSVAALAEDGRRVRVPFVACELFAHSTAGTVAFAFTTPGRLAAELGEAQPWIASSIGPFAEAMAEQGVTVLLDPQLAPGSQNWRPEDLSAYAQEVR
jgi:hypothetical protein